MKFAGLKKTINGGATFYHWEPGDGTRYEFVVSVLDGGGSVLAMLCPYAGAMRVPSDATDLDTGYVAEKMLSRERHSASREHTAKQIARFWVLRRESGA